MVGAAGTRCPTPGADAPHPAPQGPPELPGAAAWRRWAERPRGPSSAEGDSSPGTAHHGGVTGPCPSGRARHGQRARSRQHHSTRLLTPAGTTGSGSQEKLLSGQTRCPSAWSYPGKAAPASADAGSSTHGPAAADLRACCAPLGYGAAREQGEENDTHSFVRLLYLEN